MNLSHREKFFVALGVLAVAATILWLAVFEPLRGKLDQMDRSIQSQGKRLREMEHIAKNYDALRVEIETTEKRLVRSKGFSILSHLEGIAQRSEVKDRIVQMKPKQGQTTRFYKESVVEIKMEKISLATLVNYLHQVENSTELLKIKELKVRPRFDNKNLVDALFTISAFEPAEAVQG